MKKTIELRRVQDFHSKEPGFFAILIDRLWPRGVRKEALPADLWAKDWAPSTGLRQLFHEGKIGYAIFRQDYTQELQDKKQEILSFLEKNPSTKILLLFASRDLRENHAIVLKEVIDGWISTHQKTI